MTTSPSVWEKLESSPFFDCPIIAHNFTPYLRDYDIIINVPAAVLGIIEPYFAASYLYRFTHCVFAQVTMAASDSILRESWSDIYTDYEAWKQSGMPKGFVWGVNYSDAYPGMKFKKDSPLAKEWTERLWHPMHELFIETNGHNITLIFHDVLIRQLARADPITKDLIPLE
ncbi:MAG: YxiG-like protein [Aggregatilineales bacterium]